MPRKKYYKSNDPISGLIFIFLLGIVGIIIKHKEQAKFYSYIFLGLALIFFVVWFYLKKRNKMKIINYESDDSLLYTLRGMPPKEFEKEIANMFSRLGYKTEHIGKSHDGGIDVIAKKDGDEYLIQCKKHLTSVAGVQDVRAFNGVVSARLAKKGFFITTNGFTPEAEQEFKNNPRIELVDRFKLLEYYKMSLK